MRTCLGALTFFIPVMSFPFTPIYPTISTLQSSYFSHIFIFIPSPKRSICDGQLFTCGCIPKQKQGSLAKNLMFIVGGLAQWT